MIVDTDMSSDDIMALSYLLERKDVSVRAVTVEGTGVADGRAGAQNVRRLIRALGIRRHIPVAYGPAEPLSGSKKFPRTWRATADRMYNLNLPAWTGPEPSDTAVRLLAGMTGRSARPIVIVTLGPLTDIALALRADPSIASKVARIYSMAGAVRVPGNEPTLRRAEWNVYIDPQAASIVLRSGIPMTIVPLDASNSVPISTFFRDAALAHQQTRAMRILGTMLSDPYYTRAPVYFWDPLAAVAATDAVVVRGPLARLTISRTPGPDLGVTRIGPSGTSARLATSANASRFARDFLSTLDGGRAVTVPSVPTARRLAVHFDGTTYLCRVPRIAAAGTIAVRLDNRSSHVHGGFELVVGRLADGKSLSDVRTLIRRGPKRVPAWFTVVSMLPGPPGASAVWGVTLTPGRYALVGVLERNSALQALAEVRIAGR